MNVLMVRRLIERGVIRKGTEFEAHFNAHDLSGQAASRIRGSFFIVRALASKDSGRIVFEADRPGDAALYQFPAEDVITLDGMSLEKLARSYDLGTEGETLPSGKRRGRKPGAARANERADESESECEDAIYG
jgi:hypothetical protein